MQGRREMSELLTDQRHAYFTSIAEFGQFNQSVSNDSQDLGKMFYSRTVKQNLLLFFTSYLKIVLADF